MDYERMFYMLQCFIEYLVEKGLINGKDFISYCNNFNIDNSRKIWGRDENAAQSMNHEMHPNGKVATLELADMATIEKGMIVLDAGCGHGGASRILASNYPESKFIGIDKDYLRIVDAIFRTNILSIANVEFLQEDAYKMSFEDNKFDVIIRQHSVYGGDERIFLKECYRILKSGGKIAFQGTLCMKPFKKIKKDMADFSYNEYCDLLVNLGFEILDCEIENSTKELKCSVEHINQSYYQMVKNNIIIGIKLVAQKK